MSEKVLDEWAIALQQKKAELQKCQEEQQVSSCLKCDKLLTCELRDAYVKAVYDSMNKGTGGGFEF
ncbi:MAG: hypothetical protein L3J47_02255 [Sulfurovum sp.]|nr:hypothetical protein [Sulfurovum sp.]